LHYFYNPGNIHPIYRLVFPRVKGMNEKVYNDIGVNYNVNRTADYRIIEKIVGLLNLPNGSIIADIGAGTGNYANPLGDLGYKVFAVEPSDTMRHQAKPHDQVTWISCPAESLPIPDQSVHGVIVILAIHHFSSLPSAAIEMKRICPGGPIVLFTFDPGKGQEPWFKDYFPEIYQRDLMIFPPVEKVIETIVFDGPWLKEIVSFPLPKDLSDKNMHSAWSEPEKYFDAQFRQNTSGFALAEPLVVQTGLARLKRDLQSGAWDNQYGYLRNQKEFDAGFTFIKLQKK
jgi:ubiquinone/menaquinone biosynthesis C-methylase UbiE